MKQVNDLKYIEVKRHPNGILHHGILLYGDKVMNCCLGRSGITTQKKEGDGATPAGQFKILYGFFRGDRIKKPTCNIFMSNIELTDGWCDAPELPQYNSLVKLPFEGSHEIMTRKDRLYDICIVLDYNMGPKIKGRGSAIFFHLTSPELKPTEGCIAIDPKHMQLLLPMLAGKTEMIIHP